MMRLVNQMTSWVEIHCKHHSLWRVMKAVVEVYEVENQSYMSRRLSTDVHETFWTLIVHMLVFLLVRITKKYVVEEKVTAQVDEEENKGKEKRLDIWRLVDIYDPEFQVGKKEFWGRVQANERGVWYDFTQHIWVIPDMVIFLKGPLLLSIGSCFVD